MNYIWLVSVLLLASLKRTHSHDFFVSTTQTASLVKTENQVISLIHGYVHTVETRMDLVKEKLKKYASEIESLEQSEHSAENNPLHAYLLMKRTTVELQEILDLIVDPNVEDLYNDITEMHENGILPNPDDLHGAASALVRLQFTYGLNASSMAKGLLENQANSLIVPTISTTGHLSARDCFFLGQHSFNENLLKQSIEWYETAMLKADTDWYPNSSTLEILPHLENAVSTLQNYEQVPSTKEDESFEPVLLEEYTPHHIEDRQYRRLCRGERLRPISWDNNLHCKYSSGNDAFFRLSPIKVEVMSEDPYIALLHDVINDRQIEIVKEVAKPKLARSSHYGSNGTFEKSLWRTSANAWLEDRDHSELTVLNRRLSMITGLKINSSAYDAESYQVVNYGIGGHYVPHHDYLQIKTENGSEPIMLKNNNTFETMAGDRLATFMFYLTDVEAGGATVFPSIGISVFPKKGSAAFWWNLKSNGEGDFLTRHGACPVLYGTKWVANKWFRTNNQFLARPCSRDQTAKFVDL